MKKTILPNTLRFCSVILVGLFALFAAKTEAATHYVTRLPAVVSTLPKVSERIVTRFNQAAFERLRHRQLSLGATFMPSYGASSIGGGVVNGGCSCGGNHGGEIFVNPVSEPVEGEIIYEDNTTFRGQAYGQPCYLAPCRPCGLFTGNGSLWFQNYGDFVTQQNRNGFNGYKADSYGFSFGYDFGSTANSIWGIALGGACSDTRIRNTDQTMDTDSFLVVLYGARTNSVWNLMGSLGYIHSSFETQRREWNTQDLLQAEHHGNTFFGSFELSTALFQDGLSVSPFFGLDIIGMRRKEFGESGLPNWEVEKRSHWSYLQSLGLRFERSYYATDGWLVNPSLSFAWLHDYGSRHITVRSTSTGSDSYTFKSTPVNKNRFAVSLNVSASLQNNMSLFVRYDGEFNRHYNAQTVHCGVGLAY